MRKWIIIMTVLPTLFVGLLDSTQAYSISQPESNDLTNGINAIIKGVLKGFAPTGSQEITNTTQAPPPTASSSFSAGDVITPLKAVLTLVINLFFVIIQVTIDILKVLLSVISNYKP